MQKRPDVRVKDCRHAGQMSIDIVEHPGDPDQRFAPVEEDDRGRLRNHAAACCASATSVRAAAAGSSAA